MCAENILQSYLTPGLKREIAPSGPNPPHRGVRKAERSGNSGDHPKPFRGKVGPKINVVAAKEAKARSGDVREGNG